MTGISDIDNAQVDISTLEKKVDENTWDIDTLTSELSILEVS